MLHRRIPENIRLFTVVSVAEVVAGGVLYDTAQVTPAQYLGCNEFGRKTVALDILLARLLESGRLGSISVFQPLTTGDS